VPPQWLTIVGWISIALAFLTAAAIVRDIFIVGNRQHVWIMDAVWPLTALYFGPLAWLAYTRWGQPNSHAYARRTGRRPDYGRRVSIAISDSHCGAGCVLGDIIGEWLVFALATTLAGSVLLPEYLLDFALALIFGIAFQYFAIVPMRRLTPRQGVIAALKSDTLSVITFEIGLFGWMALMFYVFFPGPHLGTDHSAYWLLMQIGMVIGFATSYPANAWLIRSGIKEAM
jgi:Domain of unknown function (DUF4396)